MNSTLRARLARTTAVIASAVLLTTSCEIKDHGFFAPLPRESSQFYGSVGGMVRMNGTGASGYTISGGGLNTTTRTDGSYELLDVTPGLISFNLSGVPAGSICDKGSGFALNVLAGVKAIQNIECSSLGSATVSITVNGSPRAGLSVLLGGLSATTTANGTATFTNVPAGQYPLSVLTTGLPTGSSCTAGQSVTVSAGANATAAVTCTAPTTGTIAGVVTVNGIGAGGITVSTGAGGQTTTTGATGSYTLTGVAPGTPSVTFTDPNGANCGAPVGTVVNAGETTTLNQSCTRPTTGGLVGVISVNNTPTSGVTVSAGGTSVVTNASGVYQITGLSGTVTVTVTGQNLTCTPVTRTVVIVVGSNVTVDFACDRPTTGGIIGVVSVNNAPTSGVTVTAGGVSVTTNASGVYQITGLTGSVTVTITGQNLTCTPITRTVVIVIGSNVAIDFQCDRPVTGFIGGRLTWDGGSFVNQQISVGGQTVRTATDGTFLISGLTPGSYTVTLVGVPSTAVCPTTSVTVTVTIGNTTTVNFSCTTLTFNITFSFKDWIHFNGFSVICFNFATSPVQANTPFTTMATGPSVQSGAQNGMTSATGVGTVRYNIGLFGSYTIIVNILNQTSTTSVNVTSNAGNCPSQ